MYVHPGLLKEIAEYDATIKAAKKAITELMLSLPRDSAARAKCDEMRLALYGQDGRAFEAGELLALIVAEPE